MAWAARTSSGRARTEMKPAMLMGALALAACGGSGPPDEEPAPGAVGGIFLMEFSGFLIVNEAYLDAPPAPTSHCTTSTVGGCALTECRYSPNVSGLKPRQHRAGVITVKGLLEDGSLGIASNNPLAFQSRHWARGTPLTISAAGAVTPPFELTIKRPKPIQLVSPKCTFPCDEVRPGLPLTIAWEGEAEATVVARLTAGIADNGRHTSVSAECVLTHSPVTLPPEVLRPLEAVDGSYFLSVVTQNQLRYQAGAYDLLVQVSDDVGGAFVR